MNKLVCIVGMTGSGKSLASDFFARRGYGFVRFGQITLDIVRERGQEPTEENERGIRLDVRKKYGMGAYATLNIPKFDELLEKGNVVGDGLYSWSEYKILKERYAQRLVVIAIYAPPNIRYERLANRKWVESDRLMRHRPSSAEQSRARDYSEIESIEKGGPIAMADFTIVNTGTPEETLSKLEEVARKIEKE